MKHLPIGIIYGFVSLISFMGSDYSSIGLKTLTMLLMWIMLLVFILNIQWTINEK